MTETLIYSNIPIEKVNNINFQKFINKYTEHNCPSPNTLRKYINEIYEEKLIEVKEYIGNNDYFLVLDDSMDIFNRYTLNVLIGRFDGNPTNILAQFTLPAPKKFLR